MIPKDHNFKFTIVGDYIECRKKTSGEYLHTICCDKCVKELKKVIEKFERRRNKK